MFGQTVLDSKFSALVAEWEAKESAAAAAKEEERRLKQAEVEKGLRTQVAVQDVPQSLRGTYPIRL